MELIQKQIQQLSQRQLLGLNILQMTSAELEQHIQELAQSNPMIEPEDTSDQPELSPSDSRQELLSRWYQDNDIQNRFFYGQETDDADTIRQVASAGGLEETLSAFLRRQLKVAPMSESLYRAILYLIDCLDDNGYLPADTLSLCRQLGWSDEQYTQALEILRSLEPAGVGAYDLSECLTLQLERLGEEHIILIAASIAKEHLESLARGHDRFIAQQLNVTVSEVVQARAVIQQLEPRPGSLFHSPDLTHYVIPDIFVVSDGDTYEVVMRKRERPFFSVDPYYTALLQKTNDAEVRTYLSEKLHQIENLSWAIQQRESTLSRCAKAIVRRQQAFFAFGTQQLVPLTMSELADELELHESTVSRAVRDKFLQCAQGIFPLSYFFSRSAGVQSGSSGAAVRSMILELLKQEDPAHPLSDQKLCSELEKKGCVISRRTVAKYREELHIPSTSRRRNAPR